MQIEFYLYYICKAAVICVKYHAQFSYEEALQCFCGAWMYLCLIDSIMSLGGVLCGSINWHVSLDTFYLICHSIYDYLVFGCSLVACRCSSGRFLT